VVSSRTNVAVLALASFAHCVRGMKQYIATISTEQLTAVTGGMQWEQFRRSTHVEDRRSPAAVRRDEAWWQSQHAPQSQTIPLPPRRPDGI
jgi:hypothetical protein